MTLPNVVSVIAILTIILPAVQTAISQQYPTSVYWWSSLIVAVIAAVLKAFEVYLANKHADIESTTVPQGSAYITTPKKQESSVKTWLLN